MTSRPKLRKLRTRFGRSSVLRRVVGDARSAIVQDWLAHTDSNSKRPTSASHSQRNDGPSLSLTEAFDMIAEGSESVTSSEGESRRSGKDDFRGGSSDSLETRSERRKRSSRKRRRSHFNGVSSSESEDSSSRGAMVIDLAEDTEEQRAFRLSKLSPEAQERLGRCKDICIKGLTRFHGDIVLLVSFDEGYTDLVLAKDAKRLFPDVYFDYLESLLVFERSKDA